MAKQKKQGEIKEESIGSLMKGKTTQKERNILLKAKLIESGELEETPIEKMGNTKERNLYLKAQLEKYGNKE
jgi:hypothetical protein